MGAKDTALVSLSASRKNCARVNRNLSNLPKHLPRIEKLIEPDRVDYTSGCGQMHRIGEDRSERLDIISAQLRVTVAVRPNTPVGDAQMA